MAPRRFSASFFSSSVSSPTPDRMAFVPMLVARRAMLRRNSSGIPPARSQASAWGRMTFFARPRMPSRMSICFLPSENSMVMACSFFSLAQTNAFWVSGVGSTSPGSMATPRATAPAS